MWTRRPTSSNCWPSPEIPAPSAWFANGTWRKTSLPRIPEQTGALHAVPLAMGEIKPGDSLPEKIFAALRRRRLHLVTGDTRLVKHKIRSKAEGQVVARQSVKPSPAAQ